MHFKQKECSYDLGDAEIAEILIRYGANINQKDFHGNTPLNVAYFHHGNS